MVCKAQNQYDVQPKSDGNKIDKVLTQEDKFINENFSFKHMADWKQGMRFMVEEDKYGSGTKLSFSQYKKSRSNSNLLQKDFQGKIFTVVALEERHVSCPKGRCTRTYVVMECEGTKYEYEFIGSIEEMRQANAFTTISKLIYIDEIDRARELLINKKLYFLGDPLAGHQAKFIPVTITNVGIGSTLMNSPVKIVYSISADKEFSIEMKLSGTNTYSKARKNFQDLFSFENPKNAYPQISDEIWGLIQTRNVKIGMTEKECELSWGRPEKINNSIGASSQQQWVYSAKSYLYFENGKLTSIQN